MSMNFESLAMSGGAGIVVGGIAGYAVKKLAKVGVVLAGLMVAFLGWLETKGIVTVDWEGLTEFVHGLIGASNPSEMMAGMLNFVVSMLPTAGGFAVGAAVGFKKG